MPDKPRAFRFLSNFTFLKLSLLGFDSGVSVTSSLVIGFSSSTNLKILALPPLNSILKYSLNFSEIILN